MLFPLEKQLTIEITRLVVRVCAPQQFGGGAKCGSDAIALAVRFVLDHDQNAVILHADCSNAFGTVDRAAILDALLKHDSSALRYLASQFLTAGLGTIVGTDGKMKLTVNCEGVP